MATSHPPLLPHQLLRWYTGAVTAAGGLVIAYALSQLPSTPEPLVWLPLSILTLVATRFALKLPGVAAHTSISDTFLFVSALLCGAWPATVTIAPDSVVLSWKRKHLWQQLLFNPSSSALSLWGGACVYTALAHAVGSDRSDPGSGMLIPLAGMALAYFLFNTGLASIAIAASKGASVLRLWWQHFAFMAVNYFAAASAAFCLIVVCVTPASWPRWPCCR